MAPADLLGLGTGFVLPQDPYDLLLTEATPFHCRLLFQSTDSTSNWLSFRGARHASYLLFCQAVQHFEAIFVLAARGLSIQACEMLRAIGEALDLIPLFLEERQDHPKLKKWFEGEIIPNREAREAAHRFINEDRNEPWPVKETKAGIYDALSRYSHMSYAAVLESVDVYARDFDWRRVSGFHYANVGSLPFAREMLIATITTLKQFYRFHLGDEESFRKLEQIRKNIT